MTTYSLRCLLICLVLWLSALQIASAQSTPLLIGAEDDWAPYSSIDKGQPVGMAVDIVRAIFAEAGIAAQLVPMSYDRCMNETLSGHLQGCFDTAADANLRRTYLFHALPLFSDAPLIMARTSSPANKLSLRDLEGQKVIVTSGYTYGDAFESNSKIQRVQAIGDVNTLRMLESGTADLCIVYPRILAHQTKRTGENFENTLKAVGTLPIVDLYLSFSRRMPNANQVLKKFNAAHHRLLLSHAIADIENRWN